VHTEAGHAAQRGDARITRRKPKRRHGPLEQKEIKGVSETLREYHDHADSSGSVGAARLAIAHAVKWASRPARIAYGRTVHVVEQALCQI